MTRHLAVGLIALAPVGFQSSIRPLSPQVQQTLKRDAWRPGCPVPLSGLRLLTVTHRGFDGKRHTGNVVVNQTAAAPLQNAFRKLYALHFPIRHMSIADSYGPVGSRPKDGDISGSFECRQAVPSPCTGGTGTGSWSMHAYGLAIDINPVENPYVGCGQSRDPKTRPYFDRSKHRKGMVTRRTVRAFASVGWAWGGAWTGNTKDYMHFSTTGHALSGGG